MFHPRAVSLLSILCCTSFCTKWILCAGRYYSSSGFYGYGGADGVYANKLKSVVANYDLGNSNRASVALSGWSEFIARMFKKIDEERLSFIRRHNKVRENS